jgi:hypothetical protein
MTKRGERSYLNQSGVFVELDSTIHARTPESRHDPG